MGVGVGVRTAGNTGVCAVWVVRVSGRMDRLQTCMQCWKGDVCGCAVLAM